MEVIVNDLQERIPVNLSQLEKLAKFVLNYKKVPEDAELSIALVRREDIKDLNEKYRGVSSSTDVLAFSLEEDPLLGEVIISPEEAMEQAKVYGNSFDEELFLLLIHGILHLLGYEDETEEDKKKMEREEKAIFNRFLRQV